MKVVLTEGDISAQKVDAVVNAANDHLWMGSGVAGALKRRGGDSIEREAVAKGPLDKGCSMSTGAGNLPARYVIHAVVMGQDLVTDTGIIVKATRTAVLLAEALELRTVALPALGTGVGGVSLSDCANALKQSLLQLEHVLSNVEEVRIVLYGREAYEEFSRAW